LLINYKYVFVSISHNWSYAMVKKWLLVLTAAFLTLSPLYFSSFEVNASPVIGPTTVTTLYSIADAYVNASSSETNYGSGASLCVSANSEQDFTYVKFDLTSIPSGANVVGATLLLYLSSTGGSIYAIPADTIGAYYCSDNSWTELGITWNNKPSFNPQPTDTWSFGILYYVNEYKSWSITADVKTALTSGILTEVLTFKSKTGNGHALFHSREGASKPELRVEYSMQPVFSVNLESVQDTGATNNLGLITLTYVYPFTFSLPTAVDVVAGSYQILYSGYYKFMRWETSGGVTVSNASAANTTMTVSDSGTLKAVGNVEQIEYTYDHGTSVSPASESAGYIDAVRFTPLSSGQLLTARFYMDFFSSYLSNTFKVHVMDENRHDVITPFEQTPTSEGWFDVDLSSRSINVDAGTDFYIGMEWITNYNPTLGADRTSPSNRSWCWNGTQWQEETSSDFMIRAVATASSQPTPSPTPSPTPATPTPTPTPTPSPSPTATPAPSTTPNPTPTPTPSPSPSPSASPSTSPSMQPSTQGLSLPRELIYAAVGAIIIVIIAVAAVVLKKRPK
jgi:hypothetical protein